MSSPAAQTLSQLLSQALAVAGIDATRQQRTLLARHLQLVIEKNRTLNLTRIVDEQEAVYLHVIDSLLLLDAFAATCEGPFVDMGTGAGFPGIPLAVMTERPALLVDSVGKKVAAVQEFVSELGLSGRVEARHARIEDLAREQRGMYAAVTARAVAQTNVLVEYATPLLQPHGRLVVAKARPSQEELEAAERAAKVCGLRCVSRETYELPGERGHREVISYERVGNPHIRLPRAAGMAKKQPLGQGRALR